MSALEIKHLFGLRGVSKHDIRLILDHAKQFREILERPVKKVPSLRGMTVVNLFFENSTRTRTSFELAEKRLSADTVNFASSNSSVKKGETLVDTLRNIEAMKIDIVVVRHKGTGVPKFLADNSKAIIVNAGDGAHDKNVTIIGDIRHSRVARSNLWGMSTMGAHVTLCGPSTLVPRNTDLMNHVTWEPDVKKAVANADAIIALRLQKERMDDALLPSMREYRNTFGITEELLECAKDKVIIMHPGPINRGVELDSDIADGEHSVILDQVTNGVAVRMAVLFLLAGGRNNENA